MKKFLVFILYALMVSCEPKEEPADLVPEPEFYVKGTADGMPVNLQSGVNGNVMDAKVSIVDSGLLVFTGHLGNKNCISCGPALTFSIRNYVSGSSFNVDSSLMSGEYDFYNSKVSYKKYYLADFYSQSKGNGSTVTNWAFTRFPGNGQLENYQGEHVRLKINESNVPATVHVVQTNLFSSGCNSSNEQTIAVPSYNNGFITDFNTNFIDDETILFNTIPVKQSTNWNWDFGDATTASGNLVKHTYDSTGTYKVCMYNDSTVFCKYVNTKNASGCISNFTYKTTTVTDKLQLSNVKVEWRDFNGRLYSSELADNSGSSNLFRIVESAAYEPNSNGNNTMKLKVLFNCKVSDGIDVIELKDVEAVIAVAY